MSIEAMKQALEALEIWEQMYPMSSASAYRLPAITSLRQAIAEAEKQEQSEPVGWVVELSDGNQFIYDERMLRLLDPELQFASKRLYTHPQPKQKPVAVIRQYANRSRSISWSDRAISDFPDGTLLYAHPQPKREPL